MWDHGILMMNWQVTKNLLKELFLILSVMEIDQDWGISSQMYNSYPDEWMHRVFRCTIPCASGRKGCTISPTLHGLTAKASAFH